MADVWVGSVNVGVVPNAEGWEQKLKDQILPGSQRAGDEAGKDLGVHIAMQMEDAGKLSAEEFGAAFKKKLEEVIKTLPKIQIGAESTEADRKIAELRANLEELSNIDVIDDKKAMASLAVIDTGIKDLKHNAGDIKVKFDTKEALAQLELLKVATNIGVSGGGGPAGRKSAIISSSEALIGTGAGAASAGSGVLGNIMGFFGGIKGLFGDIGGSAGNTSKAAASSGGGLASLASGGLTSPLGIAAMVAAAPFIGQVVGGAIVGVLGGGLAVMGIAGAAASGKLAKPWADLTKTFNSSMKQIGEPMIPMLKTLLGLIGTTVTQMTPIFQHAVSMIAGPLGNFMGTFVKAFASPDAQKAIIDVAGAFVSILKAVTPAIGPAFDLISRSISKLAEDVAKDPQAMANVFQYLMNIINFLINMADRLMLISQNPTVRWMAHLAGVSLTPPSAASKPHQTIPAVSTVPGIRQQGAGFIGPVVATPSGFIGPVVQKPIQRGAFIGPIASGNFPANLPGEQNGRLPVITGPRGGNPLGVVAANLFNYVAGSKGITDLGNSLYNLFVTPDANQANKMATQSKNVGKGVVTGIQQGMTAQMNMMPAFTNQHIVTPTIKNMKNGFQTGSPAKVMIPLGNDIAGGIFLGIQKSLADAGIIVNSVVIPVVGAIRAGFERADASSELAAAGRDIIHSVFSGIKNALTGVNAWVVTNVIVPIVGAISVGAIMAGGSFDLIGQIFVNGLKTGISNAMVTIGGTNGWGYNTIVKPIIDYLLSPSGFNIQSPSKRMVPIGKQVVSGIIHGMLSEGKNIDKFVAKVFDGWPKAILSFVQKGLDPAKLPKKALSMFENIVGTVGAPAGGKGLGFSNAAFNWIAASHGGVAQWAGLVSRALTMLRLPQNLSGKVLYQMQTESGGNPNAINNWDINARRGDPSKGLLQTTGATFSRYHVAGTAWNIYDPLANIAAAINYARHVYGPTLMNAKGHGMGSGSGYDTGGWLPPGVTLAYNLTGQPERILSPGELKSLQAGGVQYHAHFDGLTGAAIEAHVQTAFRTMSLTQGALQRQGRRT